MADLWTKFRILFGLWGVWWREVWRKDLGDFLKKLRILRGLWGVWRCAGLAQGP